MNQIAYIPYFIPCIVALFCAISLALRQRTPRQTVYMVSEFLSAFYLLVYALYIQPNTDYSLMIRLDSWCIPAILTIEALAIAYMHMLHTRRGFVHEYGVLFVPAIVLGSVNGILYYLMGYDKATEVTRIFDQTGVLPDGEIYKLYHLFAETLVNATTLIMGLVIIALCIRVLKDCGYRPGCFIRFCQGKTQMRAEGIIAGLFVMLFALFLPLILLGRVYLMEHMAIGIGVTLAIAIVKFLICHTEIRLASLHPSPFKGNRGVYSSDLMSLRPHKVEQVPTREEEELEASERKSTALIDLTYQRFKHLMIVDEIYRDADLTTASLSEKMGIGRTTLSTMMKLHYDASFRDILNRYRIEAVQRYMLEHPDATQEITAQKCGFRSGNYLNTKFKEIVGDTPMMWLAKQHFL